MSATHSPKFERNPLTPDQIDRLISACSSRAPTGLRNRALLVLLWRGGLRCSEALDLELRDVNLTTGNVTVRHGKGDKRRVVRLDARGVETVARWIDRRLMLGVGARSKLLCTLQGGRLGDRYVRRLLKRLGDRAGIPELDVHPHGLRHAFALELVQKGFTLPDVRDSLGHSTVGVTDVYLRRLEPTDLLERLGNRTWGEQPALEAS